jgi:hypothetical protein
MLPDRMIYLKSSTRTFLYETKRNFARGSNNIILVNIRIDPTCVVISYQTGEYIHNPFLRLFRGFGEGIGPIFDGAD